MGERSGMNLAADLGVKKRLLTVDAYHRMGEAGIFAPDERVELIEGEVVEMAPIGSRHSGIVTFLTQQLVQAVDKQALVSVKNPVRLSRFSEPQPDFALLKQRADYYRAEHPRPEDVLLIVEVAETSLAYDRRIKLPLYAAHGILEVWIVDVESRVLEIHRAPENGAYASTETVRTPGVIRLAALPEIAVDLSGLF